VEWCLLGFLDVQNPAAISRTQVSEWEAEGLIRYLGVADDIRPELGRADCVVLPSYREGTPRSLLEAAAMAKPIITTDAVGCREVVENGVNGYLCQVGDASDLADRMASIIAMSHADREAMGKMGRIKVECEFDENIVINKYLKTIASILSQANPP
jgi:glycosyltransferase involved in cell wall biosynthesis